MDKNNLMQPNPKSRKTILENTVFLTTTYGGRLPLLIATLSQTMMCISKATFVVQWYDDPEYQKEYEYAVKMLPLIACPTDNTVIINKVPASLSVAATKFTHWNVPSDMKWFVNLDDDLLIPSEALFRLRLWQSNEHQDVITLGVMDVANVRGYDDYDNTQWPSTAEFLELHPAGKAKHHCFLRDHHWPNHKWVSQLYCLKRQVFDDKRVTDPVLAQFTERGVRGYDIVLENTLAELGYRIVLISGQEALHVGLEHGYLEGPWKKAHAIANTVVSNAAIRKQEEENGQQS